MHFRRAATLIALGAVLTGLGLGVTSVQAGTPCLRGAKQDGKDCNATCMEGYQTAKDACVNRDHDCVEVCRADRAQCHLDSGFDAAIDTCNDLLDARRKACRDAGKTGDDLDQCIDRAQVQAFQCRDSARELANPLLKQCRRDFRACAKACPLPDPPASVDRTQCLLDAKAAVNTCLGDCREDFQVAKDTCRNRDHACVEDCRTARHACAQPLRDQLEADVAACNQDRADGITNDCDVNFPPPQIAWDHCVDGYQVTAFVCRDNAHEAARPGLQNCREQFQACAQVSDPPFGTAFADPPVAPSTRNGNIVDVTIEARMAADDLDGATATFLTYGGGFLAPAIQAKRGDLLRLHFTNALPASGATNLLGHPRFVTNLHAHGLHVTPGTNPNGTPGDDVFRSVAAGGGRLDYEYDLARQPAGSMGLYHPHQHGAVAEQIWGGMIGPIDVADEPGSPLAAYETHLLVLKDISLSGGAPAPYDSILDYVMGKEGNLVMVNGQVNPVLAIRPGQVQRWRIFNASTARFYRLSLEGHALNVIGTDGGLLDRPYPVREILVAPAERLDVLVQASPAAGSFRLLALPYDRGGMGGMPGFGGTPSAPVTLLTLDDAGAAMGDVLPAQVDPAVKRLAIDAGSLPRTRFVLGMMMGRGTINGVSFDEMADGTVRAYQHDSKVGTYEVWEIVNQTGMDHPWHQHVNAAQVLSASGPDPAFATYADLYTRVPGLKDTVIVPKGGSITLLVPIIDHTGKTMFHCHIVEHEDIGMMGIWNIEP